MLATLLLVAATVAPVQAGQSPITIRTDVHRATGEPVASRWVVAHRIASDRQGPVDSIRTNATGMATLRVPRDSAVVYIVTALHDGIQYFSEPVAAADAPAQLTVPIIVHDTSSTVPIRVLGRYIVVAAPEASGARTVVELISLFNGAGETRISRPDRPSWALRLPDMALDASVDASDLAADAISTDSGQIRVFAPLTPGERQLTVQYRLPPHPGRVEWLFPDSVEMVNVLLERADTARMETAWLSVADSGVMIEGREFARFAGGAGSGASAVVQFPALSRIPGIVLPLLVGLVAGVLGVVGFSVVRKRPEESLASLADRLARLPDDAPERAELARRLESRLAMRRTTS